MPISALRVCLHVLAYMGLALLPMAVAMLGDRPTPRALLVEIGAMLGLLALGVLSAQLVITGRHRWFAAGIGQDKLLQFHRRTGVFGGLLVLAHPTLLMLGDSAFVAWLDPREGALRALTLIGLLLAVGMLVASSLWRLSLGLSYEAWRSLHALLALAVVAGGLGHALMGNHHTAGLPTQLGLVLVVGAALFLVLEGRLWRPWQLRRRPWRIVEVEERRAESTRLVLEAQGHSGLHFRAGQYAWLTIGDSPFALEQHPFSMASSPDQPDRIEFIAKQLGDFTRRLPRIDSGTCAFVEGPYGVFSIDIEAERRAVLIAGGIGITPMLSMLRACRAHGRKAPIWLIYGNADESEIIARELLDQLVRDLPLTLVHVLEEPSEDWTGPRGFIDVALLEDTLPPDADDIDYFVCGPPPMMDQVEPLLRQRGVAARRLYSERFNLV